MRASEHLKKQTLQASYSSFPWGLPEGLGMHQGGGGDREAGSQLSQTAVKEGVQEILGHCNSLPYFLVANVAALKTHLGECLDR